MERGGGGGGGEDRATISPCNAPVNVNLATLLWDMWGFSGALSPYWQLFESPVCGGFAGFVTFFPEECGVLVGDSL